MRIPVAQMTSLLPGTRAVLTVAALILTTLSAARCTPNDRLPDEVREAAIRRVEGYYTRQSWGARFGEVDQIRIFRPIHVERGFTDDEDVWCFGVEITGQRQGVIDSDALYWFASRRLGEEEWYVAALAELAYPFPYMEACGVDSFGPE